MNKPPVTMMLGDASISFLNNQTVCANNSITNIEDCADSLCVNIECNKSNILHIELDIDKHAILQKNKLDKLIIYAKTKNKEYKSIGAFVENKKLHIIVYSYNKHNHKIDIIIMKKISIDKKIYWVEKQIKSLEIFTDFMLLPKSINMLKKYKSIIIRLYKDIKDTLNINNLYADKYVNIIDKLDIIYIKIKEFYETLAQAILLSSSCKDTHLILNCADFITETSTNILSNEKCYICGNKCYTMMFSHKEEERRYKKNICPRCEIISTRNALTNLIKVYAQEKLYHNDFIHIEFKCVDKFVANCIFVGVAIINTNIGDIYKIESLDQLNKLEIDFKVPEDIDPGLYYLRCFFMIDNKINISHRQIYICSK